MDVYVLTGQSNSLGTTDDPRHPGQEPPPDPADSTMHFWWSNVEDAELCYGAGGIAALGVQQGNTDNPNFWGPEFGFCRRLRQHTPHQPILFVKASRGGGGNGNWLKEGGHMYGHVVKQVRAALAALPPGQGYRLRALLYIQGESDSPAEAAASGERLEALIRNLRTPTRLRTCFTV